MNKINWTKDAQAGRRSWIASYLAGRTTPLHIKELGEIVGRTCGCPVPEDALRDNKTFHASRYRRVLSGDIDALNRDPDFPYCIISDTDGVRVCNKAECEKLYAMERTEALRKLAKCSIIARKAGLHGQMTVTADEVRSYVTRGDTE